MAGSEIVAHIGDTGVLHYKMLMWSTIDSTQWEPLALIMDDSASNQVKSTWESSDVTVNARLRAGYQAYLTLWNGSDGEFRHGIWEAFVRFENPTIPGGHLLAHAMVLTRLKANESVQTYGTYNGGVYYADKPYHQGGTIIQDLFMQRYIPGGGGTGAFTETDWYHTEDVTVNNSRGYVNDASNFTYDAYLYAGADALLDDVVSQLGVTSGAQLQYVFINDQTNVRTIGTFSRRGPWYYVTMYSASDPADGTRVSAPRLILSSIPRSPLTNVLGASIQLLDGSHVYLEKNAAAAEVKLMRKTTSAAAPVQIGSLTTGITSATFVKEANSYQMWALCADTIGNIYVVGTQGNAGTNTLARAFKRSAIDPNSWTGQTVQSVSPTNHYFATINNRSCAWTPSSNPSYPDGFLVVAYAHRMGSSGTNGQWGQQATVTLDASVLLGNTANPVQRAVSKWDPRGTTNPLEPRNPMGTGLDLTFMQEGQFVAVTLDQRVDLTQNLRDGHLIGKVTTDAQGGVTNVTAPVPGMRGTGLAAHDSAGKLRVVDMHSADLFGVMIGGLLTVYRYSDNSTVASIDLTAASIPGFPSRAGINQSAAWDVWYDQVSAAFRVYYIDSANPRRLLRFGWAYQTNTLINGAAPVQLMTNIGPSGGKVMAIRLPRKRVDERWVHLEMGVLAADNVTESLVTYEETAFNVAPNKPTLADIPPFNATTTAGAFSWTFDDGNPADRQGGYELEIKRTSDNVTVYSPGFVAGPTTSGQLPANHTTVQVTVAAGTLTNGTSYQARVRVYDQANVASAWSDWKPFATSATGGLVVIVNPPFDNSPVLSSSTLIDWEFTGPGGATQTSYRIKIFRTSDNVLLQDTGAVTSPDTQAILSNLVSGVEQRVEVVVTDSSAGTSAPGIRLITPNFGNPQKPLVNVVVGDSYLELRITNPTPGTDQPQVIRNDVFRRETGTSTWTRIGQTGINGIYRDYATASGKQYDYRVDGVS